ncbi:MAG: hypothetical protein ACYC6G_06535 [Desulfobaccales bacterium]
MERYSKYKCSLVLFIIFIITTSASYGQSLTLTVAAPEQNAEVGPRAMVKGKISDPSLQVFILIRSMATNDFWIQPVPIVASNGAWASYCYFGEPNEGRGDPYEIIAIASSNKKLLKEGKLLYHISEIKNIAIKTDPIIVTRAK